jgi:hypothetical protein
VGVLDRAAILAAPDIRTETVAVPAWGGEVIVRGLTGAERDAYEQRCHDTKYANIRATLLALALVDAAGVRLFTLEDVERLGAKSAAPLDHLFDVARRLSGIGQKDVQELVGNSEPGLNGSSTSGSRPVSAAR